MARVSWVNEMSHSFSLSTHLSPKKERESGKPNEFEEREIIWVENVFVCSKELCLEPKGERRDHSHDLRLFSHSLSLSLFLLNPWQRDIEKRTMSRCICLECVYVCLQVYGREERNEILVKMKGSERRERDGEKRWEKKKRLLSFSQREDILFILSLSPQVKHSAVAAKASFTSWVLVSTQC